jgi:class 3 adenylate cyclase
MACGGLKFVEDTLDAGIKLKPFPVRALELAFQMLEFTNQYTYKAGKQIKIKIGIHCGNCIYGVIGYHKPQFSLIGDTVNTTSRYARLNQPLHHRRARQYRPESEHVE